MDLYYHSTIYNFIINDEHLKYVKYERNIFSAVFISYKEDRQNKIDKLYTILILNSKVTFLAKVSLIIPSRFISSKYYYYDFKNAEIIAHLGEFLTEEQIKDTLDAARLLG